MKEISVIVPIYNVEQYLNDAIDSIINQTIFESIDVILVNDGSKDNSVEIARKYVSNYNNIRLVEKENGGLSSARNYGLTFVNTQYVMFLDSDDMYTVDACEQLLKFAKENDTSITMGDLETFPIETPNYKWKKYFGYGNNIIDLHEGGEDLLRIPSACNKLFRTRLFKGNKEVFPNNKHFEDGFAIIPLLIGVAKIGIVDTQVYRYRQRDDGTSIMGNVFIAKKNYYDHFELNNFLYKQFIHCGYNEQIQYSIKKFIIQTNHGFINNIFLRKTIAFTEEELIHIFNRLTIIYQTFEWQEFGNTSKHRLLKNVYYALYTNDLKLFLNPNYYVSTIKIQENQTVAEGKIAYPQIKEMHLFLSLEYISDLGNQIEFVGEIISNNTTIDNDLKNDFWVKLRTENKSEIKTVRLSKFNKLDSPYISNQRSSALGFRFSLDKSVFKENKGKLVFDFLIEDYATGILKNIVGQAHGFLHKYKGYLTKDLYLEIHPTNRKIYLYSQMSILEKVKLIKSKYIYNGRLKVGAKLRFLYKLTNWYLKRKKIVLIAERSDTFQDNSSAFFKGLRNLSNKNKSYYYLLDRSSSFFEEAKKYGNVIAKDSIKHYLYLLSADTIVNSYDPDSYMSPSAYSKPDYFRLFGDLINYKRVFLQHGVTYNNVVSAISNYRMDFDGLVVTNELEKEMFMQRAFYKEENLVESGFSRYERLKENMEKTKLVKSDSKKILFMPTWRRDLAPLSYIKKSQDYQVDATEFLNSKYYAFYKELLSNKKLHEILEKNDIYLEFYPHYEMRVFLPHFEECETERISIVPDSKNVQDLLIECDALITDYSSVFFDVLFMKKPVLFTQFDLEEFYARHYKKGYLDFSKNELGRSVQTIEETLDGIQSIIENNYELNSETNKQVERYLKYAYSDNNKLILEFIESL